MLPKAHLTSHSRMSGSRWVITSSWLSGSWRSLLYSSVYSCHLFLISSASVRSIPFLSFTEPIFVWNVPLVSLVFLKKSLVFPILLFSSLSLHQRRQWHPTPVLLPGKFHGQRSLVGCSPWGWKESDMTERLHFHFSLSCTGEGNGNPLRYSCLENPRDGGAWWAAIYGVAQSRTRLKQLSSSSNISLHRSLRKAFFSLLAILWKSALEWVYFSFSPLPFTSLLSQLFVRSP